MKWVFGTLLVINVTLLMWGAYHQRTESPLPPPRGSVNADAIRLLSAYGGLAGEPEAEQPPPRHCYVMGPYPDQKQAAAAGRGLERFDLTYEVKGQEARTADGFRVLIGPLASAQATAAMSKRLRELGESDHYVARSEGEFVLAAGFFSRRDAAEQRVRDLAANKIEARAVPRSANLPPAHWVEFELPPARELPELLQSALAAPTGRLRPRVCP